MAGKRAHTVRSGKPTFRQRRKAPVKNVPESHRPDPIEIVGQDDEVGSVKKRERKPANDDFVDPDID